MTIPIASIVILFVAGCASFHPKPIEPSQTAAEFEARRLDDPGLKAFLEKNLHREIAPWPPTSWNFPLLTLAAFYYHPDLDLARAQWGVAEAGVITAGGRPNPSIGFTPQYNADTASGVSPWTLGFNLDIPIETAGKRGYRIDQANHLSETARLKIASAAWRVRSRLREDLLQWYAADQTVTTLNDQFKNQEEIVQQLEERLSVGEISLPDLTQSRIARDQVRLSLDEARRRKAEAHGRLAQSLGLPISVLDGIHFSFESFNRLPADFPSSEMRRQALVDRPDILSGLSDYAAAQSALQLEIAKQYPDLHLGPGYAWDQGDDKWSLGFSITLPVFNRNKGPIAEAEARRAEARARFIALQAAAIGDIDRARIVFESARRTLETAEALLAEKERQIESVRVMFETGEADRLILMSAQSERDASRLSRLEALMSVHRSLGALEDAMQHPLDQTEAFSMEDPASRPGEERQP